MLISPLSSRRASFRPMTMVCVLVFALVPFAASAASISGTSSSFTGDPLAVSIDVDDAIEPGSLVITLRVASTDPTGDLRGFFAQVSDESLLSGLAVDGVDVTNSVFDANSVINLGGGNNLNGGGSVCPCDLGLEIGSSGMGADDIQQVTFVLSHATESLTVDFLDQQLFGVRVTSVGAPGGPRNGSSKLGGVVPEPSTAVLVGLGLAALSQRLRRSAQG